MLRDTEILCKNKVKTTADLGAGRRAEDHGGVVHLLDEAGEAGEYIGRSSQVSNSCPEHPLSLVCHSQPDLVKLVEKERQRRDTKQSFDV